MGELAPAVRVFTEVVAGMRQCSRTTAAAAELLFARSTPALEIHRQHVPDDRILLVLARDLVDF